MATIYRIDRQRSFSDSNLLSNWFAPFNIAVNGSAGGTLTPLFDSRNNQWGAVNLVTRCGKGLSESAFTSEDGVRLATGANGSSINASFDETVTFPSGAKLYVDLDSISSNNHEFSPNFVFRGTFNKSGSGTLTLKISLIGVDGNGTALDSVELFSGTVGTTDELVNYSGGLPGSLSNRYRLLFEYSASGSSTPKLIVKSPGLQFVLGLDRYIKTYGLLDLSNNNIIGGEVNATGVLTEWSGFPNQSSSVVPFLPNFLSRIIFTDITTTATANKPGVILGGSRYNGDTNLINLPPSTVGSTATTNVNYPLELLDRLALCDTDRVFLNNSSTSSGATVTYQGMLFGIIRIRG